MRSLPTIALALLLPIGLSAQTLTNDYVELTVSDTMPMKLRSITYQITAQDPQAAEATYDENTDYDKMMREQNERMQKVLDKLKKELQSNGFTVVDGPAYGDPYTISSYATESAGGVNTTMLVSLKDEPELKRLVAWLRQRGHVDGSVTRWEYDGGEVGRLTLKALFDQAKAQAQQLAELGGRKLGKLLSATDPNEREMTFQDFIKLMADRDHGNSDLDAMRARMRSMTFRFALTD